MGRWIVPGTIRIAFSADGASGYAVQVEEQPPMFMLGCAGVGIARAVVVRLTEPVSADEFVLSVDLT